MKIVKLVLALAAFHCFASAKAQISLGVSVTFGETWQDYGDDFNRPGTDFKLSSFRYSLSAYYAINSFLEIGLEPAYVGRGAACEPGFVWQNPFVIQDASFEGNYIEVPLMLQGKFNVFSEKLLVMPKIGGGPAYLVNAYRSVKFIYPERSDERWKVDFEEESNIEQLDFGIHAGLAIGYQLGPGILQAEARYYNGLKDTSSLLTSLNRSLHYGLGFIIFL